MERLRKVFFLFLLFSIAWGVSAENGPMDMSALGLYISIAGNVTGSAGPGIGVLMSWNAAPLVGITWSLADESQSLGAFADWWILTDRVKGTPLSYFLGGGGYGGIVFDDEDIDVGLGLRVPGGIQFFPAKQWELFFELVPMLAILPELNLRLAADLGFRYHF